MGCVWRWISVEHLCKGKLRNHIFGGHKPEFLLPVPRFSPSSAHLSFIPSSFHTSYLLLASSFFLSFAAFLLFLQSSSYSLCLIHFSPLFTSSSSKLFASLWFPLFPLTLPNFIFFSLLPFLLVTHLSFLLSVHFIFLLLQISLPFHSPFVHPSFHKQTPL